MFACRECSSGSHSSAPAGGPGQGSSNFGINPSPPVPARPRRVFVKIILFIRRFDPSRISPVLFSMHGSILHVSVLVICTFKLHSDALFIKERPTWVCLLRTRRTATDYLVPQSSDIFAVSCLSFAEWDGEPSEDNHCVFGNGWACPGGSGIHHSSGTVREI